MKNNFKKFKFTQAQFVYLLAGLVFLVGLFLLVWFGWQYFTDKIDRIALVDLSNLEEQKDCEFRRFLDGVCVEESDQMNPRLLAVMIENHSEARPQAGLSKASVVYEAPVEANYTRFLAIYPADSEVGKIGPVRSARSYYLDWLSEYGTPVYMHVGGSPEALDLIKKYKINDLNEFYNGQYYWRAQERSAPHNVYTSSELGSRALNSYPENYLNDEYKSWKFVTTTKEEIEKLGNSEIVGSLTVSFLPPVYEAVWKYNTSTNKYERYQMGRPHVDADGMSIAADVVIVQKVETEILDSIGRLGMETIGSGEAVVFQNGLDYTGTWVKKDRVGRTRFYGVNGEEIIFNPGKIWIEVANQNTKINYE